MHINAELCECWPSLMHRRIQHRDGENPAERHRSDLCALLTSVFNSVHAA